MGKLEDCLVVEASAKMCAPLPAGTVGLPGASGNFRKTRRQSTAARGTHLPKLKWPRAQNLSISQLV